MSVEDPGETVAAVADSHVEGESTALRRVGSRSPLLRPEAELRERDAASRMRAAARQRRGAWQRADCDSRRKRNGVPRDDAGGAVRAPLEEEVCRVRKCRTGITLAVRVSVLEARVRFHSPAPFLYQT
jgi:hypothetical protein